MSQLEYIIEIRTWDTIQITYALKSRLYAFFYIQGGRNVKGILTKVILKEDLVSLSSFL